MTNLILVGAPHCGQLKNLATLDGTGDIGMSARLFTNFTEINQRDVKQDYDRD